MEVFWRRGRTAEPKQTPCSPATYAPEVLSGFAARSGESQDFPCLCAASGDMARHNEQFGH